MKDWLGGGQERWEGRRRDEVWRQIRSKRINGTKEGREREKGYRISARRKSLPLISEGERSTRRPEKWQEERDGADEMTPEKLGEEIR